MPIKKEQPKKQHLRITITVVGEFTLDALDDFAAWRDEITCYGKIIKQDVEVVDA